MWDRDGELEEDAAGTGMQVGQGWRGRCNWDRDGEEDAIGIGMQS